MAASTDEDWDLPMSEERMTLSGWSRLGPAGKLDQRIRSDVSFCLFILAACLLYNAYTLYTYVTTFSYGILEEVPGWTRQGPFGRPVDGLAGGALLADLFRTQADFHEMLNKVNERITSALATKPTAAPADEAE